MEKTKISLVASSTVESCFKCKYHGQVINGQKIIVSVCRRHAPKSTAMVVGVGQGGQAMWTEVTTWPTVRETDWCGDGESVVP